MSKHHVARTEVDEARLEDLVTRAREGDLRAWQALWLALDPMLERIAARRQITGRLADRPDERRDIVLRVMKELRRHDDRLLADLGERLRLRDGSYRWWLTRVARNTAIDYVREHAEYLGPVEGGRWARLLQLGDMLEDGRPDPIRVIEVRQILAYAEQELDPPQLVALCRWLRRESFEEIAGALRLADAAAAARLVRSGVERLRAHFSDDQWRPRKSTGAPDGSPKKSA